MDSDDEDGETKKGPPEKNRKKLFDHKTWERDGRLVEYATMLRSGLGEQLFEDHNKFRNRVDAALARGDYRGYLGHRESGTGGRNFLNLNGYIVLANANPLPGRVESKHSDRWAASLVTARQQIRRVRDALLRLVTKAGWPAIAASLALLYAFGAVLMPLLEGADSPLASLPGYSWWFIVTATTVGYGDIAPSTFGGRLVAVVIMLLGVGVIAVTVAKIAEEVVDFGRRRMRGLTQLNEKGHLVILGYCSGETGTLIQELLRDESETRTSIVLCSSVLEENPMPDKVRFVRGELSSEDVLQRACVREAGRILVHCEDENETLVAALAARSVNRSAHIVARYQRPDSELHLKRIDPNIECVPPLSVPLMVHSIQDHGTTAVISSLLSHATDDTIFRMQVPKAGKSRAFGILHRAFKEKLGASLLAMASPDGLSDLDLNPDSEKSVDGGDCLFYIAPRRILEDQIPWNDL